MLIIIKTQGNINVTSNDKYTAQVKFCNMVIVVHNSLTTLVLKLNKYKISITITMLLVAQTKVKMWGKGEV